MSQPANDPLRDLVTGYPKLAGQMGILPEVAMFRKFSALNARKLLYLQAELTGLENDLMSCEAEDSNHDEKYRYALDWFWLHHSQCEEEPPKQYHLVQQIKEKLREYSTTPPALPVR